MMKKLFLSLCAVVALSGCGDNKKPTDKDTLTVVTSADYPPYEYFEDGKIVGLEMDIVEEVAKRLGKKIDIKDMSFDGILGALQSGRADIAAASLSATPERVKAVDFSTTFYDDSRVIICQDTSSIKALIDIVGNTVGVQAGSTHEAFAQKELPNLVGDVKSKSLSKVPDLIQDMKAGRISCLMLGATEGMAIVGQNPNMRTIPVPSENSGFGLALPKNSPLTVKVNAIIKDMLQDGTIEAIKKKWIK